MEFITITAVTPLRGSTFLISTDCSEDAVSMDYEVVYCKGVRPGRKFTLEQWEQITEAEMLRNARNQAIKLISAKDMTSGALYKKLLDKGIETHAAAKTVSRCIELGEINDWNYALKAANYCLITKRYGTTKAYQWMVQKGIPKQTAQKALHQIAPQVDTCGQLQTLIEKRYAEKLSSGDYRQKQNVIAALARRGYRISEIQTAVSEYLSAQQEI